MSDDYELLPHEEIEYLRREVEKLKVNPFGDSKENRTLLASIDKLTRAINDLTRLFAEADKDMAQMHQDQSPIKLLSEIKQQNETLAKGMLALADIIKAKNQEPAEQPRRQAPPPQMGVPPEYVPPMQMAPAPSMTVQRPMPPRPDPMGYPPGPRISMTPPPTNFRPTPMDDLIPPDFNEQKKGFFGKLKR
ncbi:MAG: hypothetical protein ABIA93_02005 [Candidatus Woesearchaeota archaeon]